MAEDKPSFSKALMAPARRHPAGARSPAVVPKSKVSSAQGAAKEEPRSRYGRLSAKPAPAKVQMRPKKAAGKDESSDKKVQIKGKRGAKWLTKKLKVYLQKMEKLKSEDSPASEETGKKPSPINIIYYV